MVGLKMPWRMRLKQIRQQRMMTQQELADEVGMTKGNISRLESQKHKPYPSTIRALATALKVPVEELAYWEDDADE